MKRWLGHLLKAGVSVGIIAVIAWKTDVGKIAAIVSGMHARGVALALALIALQTLVVAYRWLVVMRGVGVTVSVWPAIQAVYVSLALNQCLPSYVGGDAYRVYWLNREGNRLALAVRGVLIDRISAVIALVVMTAVGLPWLLTRLQDSAADTALILVLLAGLGATAVFLGADWLPSGWRRVRMVAELAELSVAARRVLLQGREGLMVGPLALVIHTMSAIVMWVFAADMRLPLSFVDCLLLTPPITLLAAVPISIAGWGVREGVMVGALGAVGIGTEPALALSVLMGFGLLANGLIGLLPLLFGSSRFQLVTAAQAGIPSEAA